MSNKRCEYCEKEEAIYLASYSKHCEDWDTYVCMECLKVLIDRQLKEGFTCADFILLKDVCCSQQSYNVEKELEEWKI